MWYQAKFLVRENLLGNKIDSDSDSGINILMSLCKKANKHKLLYTVEFKGPVLVI